MARILRHLLITLTLTCSAGCSWSGLFFGGEQQANSKSDEYSVVRLDREHPGEWVRINLRHEAAAADPANVSPSSQELGDLAFEHPETGAIISLNSVCGPMGPRTLEELTDLLFLGLRRKGPIVSRDIEVDGVQALESTLDAVQGPPSEAPSTLTRIRAVVLRKTGCTYDLMYIAKPEAFEALRPQFERFVKGFHAS